MLNTALCYANATHASPELLLQLPLTQVFTTLTPGTRGPNVQCVCGT